MTWPQAREFANFLDDHAPAGIYSGTLAAMILAMQRSKVHRVTVDRQKAVAMIKAVQDADLSNCPF
jgi:hypothetical protein